MSHFSGKLQLRDKSSIARRLLCLGAFLFSLQIEIYANEGVLTDAATVNNNLIAWLKHTGLFRDLSEDEMHFLLLPFPSWSEQDLARLVCHTERLGILLWVLSMIDRMPPIDTSPILHWPDILRLVPLFGDPSAFIQIAQLRSKDEISRMDDLLTSYALRLSIDESDFGEPTMDGTVRETIKREAEALMKIGLIDKVISDDQPAFGKAVGALTESENDSMRCMIVHRLYCLGYTAG